VFAAAQAAQRTDRRISDITRWLAAVQAVREQRIGGAAAALDFLLR